MAVCGSLVQYVAVCFNLMITIGQNVADAKADCAHPMILSKPSLESLEFLEILRIFKLKKS